MVKRPGHSLVELIVAVALLGVGMSTVTAASVAATRWTVDAVRRQQGVLLARDVLDSLIATPSPGDGATSVPPFDIVWSIEGDAGRSEVVVRVAGPGARVIVLGGVAAPPPPLLPAPDTVSAAVPEGGS